MNTELCFGQRYDEELGILEPWYTNPAMDKIKTWDLSDKVICEYGAGSSTIWWCKKSKQVYAVDHNQEWYSKVFNELNGSGSQVYYVNTHEGDQSSARDAYIKKFIGVKPNIIIVDGIHRYECAEYAVNVLKPEILIIDNHQQDYVFICPALDELLKGVKMERFIQPNHTEHDGKPWATAIFYLNEKE